MAFEMGNYNLVTQSRRKKKQRRFLHKTIFSYEKTSQHKCLSICQKEAILFFMQKQQHALVVSHSHLQCEFSPMYK